MRTNRALVVCSVLSGIASVVGCGRAVESEAPRTVSWYVEHEADRTVKVKWCADDAARASTPNCVNAEQATQQIALRPNAPNMSTGVKIP